MLQQYMTGKNLKVIIFHILSMALLIVGFLSPPVAMATDSSIKNFGFTPPPLPPPPIIPPTVEIPPTPIIPPTVVIPPTVEIPPTIEIPPSPALPGNTPVETPTNTPTPVVGYLWLGVTSRGFPVSFIIDPTGQMWSNFILKTTAISGPCNFSVEVELSGPGIISGTQFSGGSTFSFAGEFVEQTLARGTYQFIDHPITACPPLNQSGTWSAVGNRPTPPDTPTPTATETSTPTATATPTSTPMATATNLPQPPQNLTPSAYLALIRHDSGVTPLSASTVAPPLCPANSVTFPEGCVTVTPPTPP